MMAELTLGTVGGLTERLRARCAPMERRWARLWTTPPHGSPHGAFEADAEARSISLPQLESVLTGEPLAPLLPPTLHRCVRARQLAFLGGRLSAEAAIRQLGLPSQSVPRGPMGEPAWPHGVVGSITHTDFHAHAMVLPQDAGASIGIDSETVVSPSAARDIALVCCTPWERAHWLGGKDDVLVMTQLFCVKEAFYKAAHPLVQRFIDFDEVEVIGRDAEAGEFFLQPLSTGLLSRRLCAARTVIEFVGAVRYVHASVVIPTHPTLSP